MSHAFALTEGNTILTKHCKATKLIHMLKARDLNEGNIVLHYRAGGVLKELILTTSIIQTIDKVPSTVYPIPITPKLLTERCGMSEGDGTFNNLSTQDGTINIIRAFIPNGGYVFCYKGIKVPLEGLHHLQNVFYFVLGYELEIK